MSTDSTTRPPGTDERAARIALSACLLRLLASALGCPTPDRFARMEACLQTCLAHRDQFPPRLAGPLAALASLAGSLGQEGYEAEYLRVLTHVFAADCNPCETSYRARHLFQLSMRMAEISGFYRAFGLDVAGERPDHIAVELEFLAFLCYRESLERAEGRLAAARTMRQAQRRFLERHLGLWSGAFAGLLRRKSPEGPLRAVADLLEGTVRSEAARLRASIPRQRMGEPPALLEAPEPGQSPLSLATGSFEEGVFHG